MKMRLFATLVPVLLSLFSIPQPAPAQQTETTAGAALRITVSVEPKKGNETPDITQQDVMVHQGKDLRPVTSWIHAAGNNAGLELAILIDDSAGINLDQQLNDIRTFIGQQPPATAVLVGYMQNGTVAVAQNFTMDHAAAAKALRIATGYYGINASPWFSLSDFVKHWPANPAAPRREVLMISSGVDTAYAGTYPDPYVDTAIRDAQCSAVVVYSIYTPSVGHFGHDYFRTYWGQNYLSELSDNTGGESYYFLGPQGPVSFAPYLQKLNEQLGNQYLLTFMVQPRPKAGMEGFKITSEVHSVDFVHQNQICVPASGQ